MIMKASKCYKMEDVPVWFGMSMGEFIHIGYIRSA